ncbi:Hypothetical protein LUCI_4719 [Lucifera butyrica]|uniref:Phosphoribosyltransferase domain-containing protein n=2 Tax=Lucifera butyrica TaxID=1351585 RepID=A0A498RDM6_9FIRM|nr:Hypothetical protein LUCI_4719 [Lucifera butyrica]
MAVCEYTGGLKRLIHDLKFRRKAAAAAYLVALLEEGFRQEWLVGVDAVVPVPLHSARLAERGYNQTELIFRPWAKRHNLVWLGDALVRSRETVPQWELPLKERKKNLQGAFAVIRPGLVAGRHILLVDDIITGGVTMNECARVLKKAGAARVSGLALASGARQ